MHQDAGIGRGQPQSRPAARDEDLRVHEVVDHLDGLRDAEALPGAVGQEAAHRRHPVARLDAELGDAEVGRVDTEHADVRAVQRGHHVQPARQHQLAREVGAGREGHGVVHVQQVEPVVLDHLHHLGRERQVVGRLLEDRVGDGRDLVEEDAGLEAPQPERQPVGDEVHVPAAPREPEPELGGDHPAAPEVGVAGDADLPPRLRARRVRRRHPRGLRLGSGGAAGRARSPGTTLRAGPPPLHRAHRSPPSSPAGSRARASVTGTGPRTR